MLSMNRNHSEKFPDKIAKGNKMKQKGKQRRGTMSIEK